MKGELQPPGFRDIRRQNMLEHLLYKAIFEIAPDRADFVSILFSRVRPSGLNEESSVASLFSAFKRAMPDRELFEQNLKTILDVLITTHEFPLSLTTWQRSDGSTKRFLLAGPTLDYGVDVSIGTGRPTYDALMTSTDQTGYAWSYLASEPAYRRVRRMEQRNLIVPVTGDFAGERALRGIGRYLNDHHMVVSVFYVSNVEYYLFRQDASPRFYQNVAALPLGSSSTFIRSVTGNQFNGPTRMGFASLSASISKTVEAFHEGHIVEYHDIVAMSSR